MWRYDYNVKWEKKQGTQPAKRSYLNCAKDISTEKRLERNIQTMLTLVISGIMINFSIFLCSNFSLVSIGYFHKQQEHSCYYFKRKENSLGCKIPRYRAKPAIVPLRPGGERVAVAGCSSLLPA